MFNSISTWRKKKVNECKKQDALKNKVNLHFCYVFHITVCPQMLHKAFNYMLEAEEMLELLYASLSPRRVENVKWTH